VRKSEVGSSLRREEAGTMRKRTSRCREGQLSGQSTYQDLVGHPGTSAVRRTSRSRGSEQIAWPSFGDALRRLLSHDESESERESRTWPGFTPPIGDSISSRPPIPVPRSGVVRGGRIAGMRARVHYLAIDRLWRPVDRIRASTARMCCADSEHCRAPDLTLPRQDHQRCSHDVTGFDPQPPPVRQSHSTRASSAPSAARN